MVSEKRAILNEESGSTLVDYNTNSAHTSETEHAELRATRHHEPEAKYISRRREENLR